MNPRPEKPRAVDLFCGCGGLTLGLKKAGLNVIGAVDNDELSIRTYCANHPEVLSIYEDIQDLEPSSFRRELGLKKGELDLLSGCPPCQGFSRMRTLNGASAAEDPRNDLVFAFVEFVIEFRPKAVMMENVPALADDARMRRVTKKLRRLGYQGTPVVLDAADYGVAQRRRRMLYMAGLNGPIKHGNPSRGSNNVSDKIRRLKRAGKSGDPLHDLSECRSVKVRRMIRRIPKNGGSRTDLGERSQLACHKKCDGFKDVYGRMSWNDVAPTITSGCVNPSKGRFLHPTQDRRITLREAALLQGFPRYYWFPVCAGKFPVAALIGNALPPPFAAQHARSIIRYLQAAS